MMGQRPPLDLSRMPTASKILLGGGLLYFIDLFLKWNNKVCGDVFGLGHVCVPANVSGWHGLGVLNGILVILILAMEVALLANVQIDIGSPQLRSMTEAGLAGALLLLTAIKLLVNND